MAFIYRRRPFRPRTRWAVPAKSIGTAGVTQAGANTAQALGQALITQLGANTAQARVQTWLTQLGAETGQARSQVWVTQVGAEVMSSSPPETPEPPFKGSSGAFRCLHGSFTASA